MLDPKMAHWLSDEAIEHGQQFDVVACLMDTYACLRPNREAFTKSSRQTLLPLPHFKQEWQVHTYSPRLKIGLTWRSMLSTVYRDRHYFKVEELAPLAELRDVDF